MSSRHLTPLLHHFLDEPSAFTPEGLLDAVRQAHQIPKQAVPPLCILEFDGDLTDWLVEQKLAQPFPFWPCFHTKMFSLDVEGVTCGVIARTIGGPYAVLIAEQLAAAGAELIVGLTSAGRVSPQLPLPCLVVASAAVRDEGTSLHYLPEAREVAGAVSIVEALKWELAKTNWQVRSGKVWTTDAPYRETQTQLQHWASEGVLAVEMQAASLFAFGAACGVAVGTIAMVSNAVDHTGEQFDTRTHEDGLRIIEACARAYAASLRKPA